MRRSGVWRDKGQEEPRKHRGKKATLEVFGFWTPSPESFVAVVETPWAANSERECYDSVAYTRWKVFGSHWLNGVDGWTQCLARARQMLYHCELHLQAISYSSQSANSWVPVLTDPLLRIGYLSEQSFPSWNLLVGKVLKIKTNM